MKDFNLLVEYGVGTFLDYMVRQEYLSQTRGWKTKVRFRAGVRISSLSHRV